MILTRPVTANITLYARWNNTEGGYSATIQLGGATGVLSVPQNGAATLTLDGYANTQTPAPITLDATASAKLHGKNLTVSITGATADTTISLAYVHYLRQSLENAVGSGYTVSITDSNLTPVFNSREWFEIGPAYMSKKFV
jgi:hypothetical protein